MAKQRLFVANWKMNFSFDEAINFTSSHYDNLIKLAEKKDTKLVLCPSFEALSTLIGLFNSTAVEIGAQDCSSHAKGSFTGQVCTESLAALGCTHVIIGHSERRRHNHETDDEICSKLNRVLDYNMSPILCIGETAEEHTKGTTLKVLEQQLSCITSRGANDTQPFPNGLFINIAYEPVWSIGTGNVPNPDHLDTVLAWLNKTVQTIDNRNRFRFLYGGSVSSSTLANFEKIPQLDGFLIGGASLDYAELEKIVTSRSL